MSVFNRSCIMAGRANDACATREEVESWFDGDGRLIKEAEMRKTLFEAGVEPTCRRKLWKFLFGVYPCHSTRREQKAWDLEHRARYRALRERWEVLDQAVVSVERGVILRRQPFYMDLSDGEDHTPCSGQRQHKGQKGLSVPRGVATTAAPPTSAPPPTDVAPAPHHHAEREPPGTPSSSSDDQGAHRCHADSTGSEPCCSICEEGGFLVNRSDSVLSSDGGGPTSDVGEVFVASSGGESSRIVGTFAGCAVTCTFNGCDGVAISADGAAGGTGERGGVVRRRGEDGIGRCKAVSVCNDDDDDDVSTERGCWTGHEGESRPGHEGGPDAGHRSPDGGGLRLCCDVVSGVSSENELDEEGKTVLEILEFPSRISATKERVDLENAYQVAKKLILSDVVRTDRDSHFFTHKRNLRKVHRILMIYALYHPDVGYAQGMNDILVQFLVVMRSEVDTYWMFTKYMEHKVRDFMEESYMLSRFAAVRRLVEEFDTEVSEFLRTSECHELLFCDRWLLIDFKREFQLNDSTRLFEVLATHYLDNDSKGLDVTINPKRWDPSVGRGVDPLINCGFELFICAAILVVYKEEICLKKEAASIYGAINGLATKMDLKAVLLLATEMYFCHHGNSRL